MPKNFKGDFFGFLAFYEAKKRPARLSQKRPKRPKNSVRKARKARKAISLLTYSLPLIASLSGVFSVGL
jgi:hypothetical protein